MWLDRIVKWFLPREDHFYDLLDRGAECVREGGVILSQCLEETDFRKREELIQKLREIEKKSDRVVAEVHEALNRTFVTPIDRSDIYELATTLEDITDDMFRTALQIIVHAIDELPQGSQELGLQIREACETVEMGVKLLRRLRDPEEVMRHRRRLEALEHAGDQIFRLRIGAMFKSETDPIKLLKHKEFLEGLEKALDACDDIGDVLGNIVIKNA